MATRRLASAALLTAAAWVAAAAEPARSPIEIEALADGVWLHRSYHTLADGTRIPSNGLIVRDGDELTLVDTAWGEPATVALLEEAGARIGLPVTRAVVTHAHEDRVAGVRLLQDRGIAVYAHPLTQQRAAKLGLPVPDRTLAALAAPGATQPLGRLEIVFPGPGHAPDNLMVWLAEERILFGGCAVRAADAKTAGNIADADLAAWPETLRRVAERYAAAQLVVPGHGDPGGMRLLSHSAALVGGSVP